MYMKSYVIDNEEKLIQVFDTMYENSKNIEGRKLKSEENTKKQKGKYRQSIYNPYELFKIVGNNEKYNRIYNFEYVMNREYAYNRDKGKCIACKKFVNVGEVHCHHKDNTLPLNEINKLKNLATLCDCCHNLVHSQTETKNKKILELRKKLTH